MLGGILLPAAVVAHPLQESLHGFHAVVLRQALEADGRQVQKSVYHLLAEAPNVVAVRFIQVRKAVAEKLLEQIFGCRLALAA